MATETKVPETWEEAKAMGWTEVEPKNPDLSSLSPEQRLATFDKMHGGPTVVSDRKVFYPDGVRREMVRDGLMLAPPEDPWEKAKAIALYHELVLDAAREKYNELYRRLHAVANLAAGTGHNPPPDGKELKELAVLAKEVRKCQASFNKADKEAKALKPVGRNIRDELTAENQQAGTEYLAKLKAIKV